MNTKPNFKWNNNLKELLLNELSIELILFNLDLKWKFYSEFLAIKVIQELQMKDQSKKFEDEAKVMGEGSFEYIWVLDNFKVKSERSTTNGYFPLEIRNQQILLFDAPDTGFHK